jgi:hypothetical protein
MGVFAETFSLFFYWVALARGANSGSFGISFIFSSLFSTVPRRLPKGYYFCNHDFYQRARDIS